MSAVGAVAMFESLADFVAEVYGGDDEMMNAVLEAAHEGLQHRGQVADITAESSLLSLLQRPLKVRPSAYRIPCHSAQELIPCVSLLLCTTPGTLCPRAALHNT
jgi:hypothetical protein